jgi:uncharacterized protein (DUF2235 family)
MKDTWIGLFLMCKNVDVDEMVCYCNCGVTSHGIGEQIDEWKKEFAYL